MNAADKLPQVASEDSAALLEQVVIHGDLSKLTPAQRVAYYKRVCESLGLNPLTKPFEYIVLNGRLTLYARKDATDQLRRLHGISIQITSREQMGDIYVVTARGTTKDGRTDESIGAVSIKGLSGDALANALMKAETKAKRRVTLSLAGLGWLDETETDTIQGARIVQVNDAGEIEPDQPPQQEVQQQAAPPQPEVVHPGGSGNTRQGERQVKPPEARQEEQAPATTANGNGQRRLPTTEEATLLRAAWRATGLPPEHQDEVLAKPRTDQGWARACREAAKHVAPATMEEILLFARALGFTADEVWAVAESHDLFPFDEPERFTAEKLVAVWNVIRAGRRVEQVTA